MSEAQAGKQAAAVARWLFWRVVMLVDTGKPAVEVPEAEPVALAKENCP
jgi:hypothetical protein